MNLVRKFHAPFDLPQQALALGGQVSVPVRPGSKIEIEGFCAAGKLIGPFAGIGREDDQAICRNDELSRSRQTVKPYPDGSD